MVANNKCTRTYCSFCACKEYWAGDFLSGILIIIQGRIERGDVIKIKNEDLIAIVLQINSFQTIVRDLVNQHDIILPNFKLRLTPVEILKTDLKRGVRKFEDFCFGCDTEIKKIKNMFKEVWGNILSNGLVEESGSFIIANKECGDTRVRWRLAYTLRLIETGNSVRELAYNLQKKHGSLLATPLTHTFPQGTFS